MANGMSQFLGMQRGLMEAGAARATGAVGAATQGKWLSKIMGFAKGGAMNKALLGLLIFDLLRRSAGPKIGETASMLGQAGAMQQQEQLMTPENLYYQAMMPNVRAQQQQAQQALLTQLLGVSGPSLAPGEELI